MYLLNIVAYHTDSSIIVSQATVSLVEINVIKFPGLVFAESSQPGYFAKRYLVTVFTWIASQEP